MLEGKGFFFSINSVTRIKCNHLVLKYVCKYENKKKFQSTNAELDACGWNEQFIIVFNRVAPPSVHSAAVQLKLTY